jgi:hypothetical protein
MSTFESSFAKAFEKGSKFKRPEFTSNNDVICYPKQTDGGSCGVFAIAFAEFLMTEGTFKGEYFRRISS